MGIDIARVIKQLEKEGFEQGAQVLSATASSLEETGLIPHELQNGSTPEKSLEVPRFSDKDREALLKNGAVIYELTGKTIVAQQEAGERFWYITDGGERLVKKPSRLGEVAIFPEPSEFFIPGSGNKTLAEQEKLAEKDTNVLRKELKTKGIKVIIPEEASTFTGVTFKYLKETGKWLLGEDYGYNYGRTKNPTNESGSSVAIVGCANSDNGLSVGGWRRDSGSDGVRVVRLVVPSEIG
ncbi:MAG: hypothetical protein AAB656_01455 [Patescibacteria group bacterium]